MESVGEEMKLGGGDKEWGGGGNGGGGAKRRRANLTHCFPALEDQTCP